jgi:hypothetical protein
MLGINGSRPIATGVEDRANGWFPAAKRKATKEAGWIS